MSALGSMIKRSMISREKVSEAVPKISRAHDNFPNTYALVVFGVHLQRDGGIWVY